MGAHWGSNGRQVWAWEPKFNPYKKNPQGFMGPQSCVTLFDTFDSVPWEPGFHLQSQAMISGPGGLEKSGPSIKI